MSKPRTPENFPRMKDRAGQRRARRQGRRDAVLWSSTPIGSVFAQAARAVSRIVDQFVLAMRGITTAQQAIEAATWRDDADSSITIQDRAEENSARRSVTPCSVADCKETAVSWLRFAGMGSQLHAHVCAEHEASDREHAEVVEGGLLPCPPRLACGPVQLVTTPPLRQP